MKNRIHSRIFGVALAVGMVAFGTGCNRQEALPPAVSAPPATTTVGTEIDDTVVTTKVKSALLEATDIKGLEIKVETRKGVVMLSGFVDQQANADRAIAVASAVEGVKGVENGMTLKEGKATVGNTVDDSIVTVRVRAALMADQGIKSSDIAVATSKGKVQLSGFVNNQAQITRAIEIARSVEGVQSVDHEMSIKK